MAYWLTITKDRAGFCVVRRTAYAIQLRAKIDDMSVITPEPLQLLNAPADQSEFKPLS